jgi:hypothetical protein
LGVNVDKVTPGVRARRGAHLPVVLSMPETMALLGAMSGTPRLMATLICGGGLRVTECCEAAGEGTPHAGAKPAGHPAHTPPCLMR